MLGRGAPLVAGLRRLQAQPGQPHRIHTRFNEGSTLPAWMYGVLHPKGFELTGGASLQAHRARLSSPSLV